MSRNFYDSETVSFCLLLALLYCLPSVIVCFRKNRDSDGWIVLVNVFLGWTLIGWVVALAWALYELTQKRPG